MFDISFLELCVVAIVTIVVVGPDKLPEVFFKLGQWTKTLRQIYFNAKRQINNELTMSALKKEDEQQ